MKRFPGSEIVSPVAGQADLLIAPDLEAANRIVRPLPYFADARAGGVVVGAQAPIILTSRADGANAQVTSRALAPLLVKATAPAHPEL
jgi:phosphotransacetylase